MQLKYYREREPVYQAFLLVPQVQAARANPVRRQHFFNRFESTPHLKSPPSGGSESTIYNDFIG